MIINPQGGRGQPNKRPVETMTMEFKIEKDVAIPTGWSRYPFGDMEIGESFCFHGNEREKNSARESAYRFGRRHGRRFTFRKTSDGYRCWRVA